MLSFQVSVTNEAINDLRSNINEVIRSILNFFLKKKRVYTNQKQKKAQKSTKNHKKP